MKTSIKNLIIVFLIAFLGAGLGTFGAITLYQQNKAKQNDPIIISEVDYTNKKESNFTKAIDKAFDTVVEVNCTVETSYSSSFFFFQGGTQTSQVSGSGVIISKDGYIVTNNHVIESATADSVFVTLFNGEKYNAKIIGADSRTDLAVLKIEADNLPYSAFVDSDELVMGEDVIAIGNPLGLGITCSNGIISALEKEIYINKVYLTVIQTNAAVNAGNSGGGLFDLEGNIVGIVNAKSSENSSETTVEGMGYAIPANTVKRIVTDLVENGFVKDRASLGIKVYTGDSYYSSSGVIVTEVTPGGSAQMAGIQANDIITAVDGSVVSTYGDLSKILDTKQVGDEVKVTVNRNNSLMEFNVKLQQAVAN